MRQLCQRIRVLTPLCNTVDSQRAATSAENMAAVRGSGVDLCNTCTAKELQRAQQTTEPDQMWSADSSVPQYAQRRCNDANNNDGSCVRGSGALTSVTQCTAKSAATSVRTTWQLCQRIRSADSATQCTAKERCNERTNNMAAVSEDQSADSSVTQCTAKRAATSAEQTWAAVQGSGG
jgi:hypothetical protein